MTTIEILSSSERYEAFVGSNLIERTGEIIARKIRPARCAIVCDEKVANLFASSIERSLTSSGFEVTRITVPSGEKAKALEQAGMICDRMIAAGLDRSSCVIALGGGVVGDLAGFVAAIFHRGIPVVQVPTTLLAQVDSSIGGKTGVNTAAGKNLIGALHHPALVIADIDTLATLSPREFNQGFAEIVKHTVIRDAELFHSLKTFGRKDLAELVRRNIEIKAKFVAADENDLTGERALLNFGHTVGHAIEYAGGYRDLLHGEAISLGIVAATEISVRKAGLPETQRAEIISMLEGFDLPTRLAANFPREKILEALPRDKKFEAGRIGFVVTPTIGSARLATDVTMEDIRTAINAL